MARPWQFDLRALLIALAALSVPFWMMAHADVAVRFWGLVLLLPVVGGCVGFVAARWAGIWPGICLAVLVELAALPLVMALFS
jgi:hypothetical protein